MTFFYSGSFWSQSKELSIFFLVLGTLGSDNLISFYLKTEEDASCKNLFPILLCNLHNKICSNQPKTVTENF